MIVKVPVKKTVYGVIHIEAESLEDAFCKIKEGIEQYSDCEITNTEDYFEFCECDSIEELESYQH